MGIVKILAIVLSVLLGIAVFIYVRFSETEDEKEKPKNVPNEAVWVGGPDGGVWIKCNSTEESSLFCKIYNDFSGTLLFEGRMILESSNNTNSKTSNDISYNFYDGQKLVLSDGRIFIPNGKND